MGIKNSLFQWAASAQPSKLLRLLSLPIGHSLKTANWFLHENARMVETACGFIRNNKVSGDYVEFGVYRGSTFAEAWHAARRHALSLRFHAFDSFSGLPEVKGIDLSGSFSSGEFSATRSEFERHLKRQGVDMSRITITEGFFDRTLAEEGAARKLGLKQVALAWIDCDLYESTVPVLDFLTDLLVDGTVLCFDDWYCFNGRPDRGQQLACSEWLSSKTGIKLVEYQKFHWAGQSFIVNRDLK